MFLAVVLPRHTFTAHWLWRLLSRLLEGSPINAAVHSLRPPFALETVYHLLGRLRARWSWWRSMLLRQCEPPESSLADPWRATFEHLRVAFVDELCPVNAFQLHTGHAVMG
jgi:hypothetical protein